MSMKFMHCFSNICVLMHVHSILLLPINIVRVKVYAGIDAGSNNRI